MTTKDYIYLGMIVLTALAFYCNGFYAGVYRCKKMYDSLLDDSEQETPEGVIEGATEKSSAASDKSFTLAESSRDQNIVLSNRELRGDFGKN